MILFFYFREQKKTVLFPRLGDEALSESKLQSLLKDREEELSKNPNDMKSLVDRGVVYYLMGPDHYADALNAFNSAWKSGAFDERIFYYSGILYENLSLFEEAQKQYERFLNHEPADSEIRLRLARLLFRMGKWEESISRYQAILDENPKDLTSLINMGLAYQKRAEILNASKNPPADPEQVKTSEAQAITYLERAAQMAQPLPEGVGTVLAQLHYKAKSWQKAVDHAAPELARNPNDPLLLEILSISYEGLNQNEQALEFYGKWSAAAPRNPVPRNKARQLKKLLNVK